MPFILSVDINSSMSLHYVITRRSSLNHLFKFEGVAFLARPDAYIRKDVATRLRRRRRCSSRPSVFISAQ